MAPEDHSAAILRLATSALAIDEWARDSVRPTDSDAVLVSRTREVRRRVAARPDREEEIIVGIMLVHGSALNNRRTGTRVGHDGLDGTAVCYTTIDS